MRDPKRIARIIIKLSYIWEKFPDMRFGQLIGGITRGVGVDVDDVWNLEDDDFEKLVDEWL
jgi:hypothetical protein